MSLTTIFVFHTSKSCFLSDLFEANLKMKNYLLQEQFSFPQPIFDHNIITIVCHCEVFVCGAISH